MSSKSSAELREQYESHLSYDRLLRELLMLVDPTRLSRPIAIDSSSNLTTHMECRALPDPQKSGYVIYAHAGFHRLVADVALTMLSRIDFFILHESFTERNRVPPLLQREIGEFLRWSIEGFLRHGQRWAEEGGAFQKARTEVSRIGSDNLDRLYFLRRKSILLFCLGHELGHIAEGHADQPAFSLIPAPALSNRAKEVAADLFGADLLYRHLAFPFSWWDRRETEGFSTEGFDEGADETQVYRDRLPAQPLPYGVYDYTLQVAHSSMAAFFAVFELIARAAEELGVTFIGDYPTAAARYDALRQHACAHHQVGEHLFSIPLQGEMAPDFIAREFHHITGPVGWSKEAIEAMQRTRQVGDLAEFSSTALNAAPQMYDYWIRLGYPHAHARRSAIGAMMVWLPDCTDEQLAEQVDTLIQKMQQKSDPPAD